MTIPAPALPPAQQHARGADQQMPTEFFYPRWMLLAAILAMPVTLVGIAFHAYFTANTCSLGMAQSLCNIDLWPGWIQVVVILALYMVLLFISASYGRGLGSEGEDSKARGLRMVVLRLTEFQRVRSLSWAIAASVTLAEIIVFLRSQLTAVMLALGIIAVFTCLRAATYHPPRRRARRQQGATGGNPLQEAQARHERALGSQSRFWNVARNTPPLRYFFSRRHD